MNFTDAVIICSSCDSLVAVEQTLYWFEYSDFTAQDVWLRLDSMRVKDEKIVSQRRLRAALGTKVKVVVQQPWRLLVIPDMPSIAKEGIEFFTTLEGCPQGWVKTRLPHVYMRKWTP